MADHVGQAAQAPQLDPFVQVLAQEPAVDTPPDPYQPREWEKPHQPNLTGTADAYRPKGSILRSAERPKSDGEYDAWTP